MSTSKARATYPDHQITLNRLELHSGGHPEPRAIWPITRRQLGQEGYQVYNWTLPPRRSPRGETNEDPGGDQSP